LLWFWELWAKLYETLLENGKRNSTYNTSSFIFIAFEIFDKDFGICLFDLDFGDWSVEFDFFNNFLVVLIKELLIAHVVV